MPAIVEFAAAADGVSVAWTASGDGPALVLSRGWITHLEHSMAGPAFRAYIEMLQTRFRVVRFDGRGNGMSDRDVPRPIRFGDLVADLTAVVDAADCERCVLWGSSWGGPAAIAFAADHPDRVSKLVLDGTFADGSRLASPAARRSFLSLFDVADAAPDAVFAALSHLTQPDADDSAANLGARGRGSISPDVARELYGLLYEIDVTALLPRVTVPTLVLHRERSRAVPLRCARQLATAIPDARLVSLPGSAHNLWDHEPHLSARVLEQFLGTSLRDPDPDAGTAETTSTMAVVFSDIVDSTAHQSRIGDQRAYELVKVHDRAMRAALARFGGREIKHTGDGIMAAFGSATAAVRAACSCQRQLDEQRQASRDVPDVAIGINAGEPISTGDDLHGLTVAIAARACAVAGAGQVIIAPVVRDLLAGGGFTMRSIGPHRLKGLTDPLELFDVEW